MRELGRPLFARLLSFVKSAKSVKFRAPKIGRRHRRTKGRHVRGRSRGREGQAAREAGGDSESTACTRRCARTCCRHIPHSHIPSARHGYDTPRQPPRPTMRTPLRSPPWVATLTIARCQVEAIPGLSVCVLRRSTPSVLKRRRATSSSRLRIKPCQSTLMY